MQGDGNAIEPKPSRLSGQDFIIVQRRLRINGMLDVGRIKSRY